jgi:HD-GYP domain-containing protein (c-di-GMP phosphodiesterase class II)
MKENDSYFDVADQIVESLPVGNFDRAHQNLLRRYLNHGRMDMGLLKLVIEERPGIIAYEQPEDLYVGAQLHDVAKAFVTEGDASIWDVMAPTSDQWRKIRKHPTVGHEMVEYISLRNGVVLPQATLDIIGKHHEKLDGSGYPFGLTGELIPSYVQLFTIVDHIVSMGEHREYRPHDFSVLESYQTMGLLVREGKLDRNYVMEVFSVLAEGAHLEDPILSKLGPWDLG